MTDASMSSFPWSQTWLTELTTTQIFSCILESNLVISLRFLDQDKACIFINRSNSLLVLMIILSDRRRFSLYWKLDARSHKKFMRLSISLWLSDLQKVISIQWGFHRATFLLRLMRGADLSRKRSWLNYFMSFAEMILQWSEEQLRVVSVNFLKV